MALKDWKKNFMNGNQHTKKNLVITLFHSISSPKDKWGVRIYNTKTRLDKFKYFDSRFKAILFYKQYMKTH